MSNSLNTKITAKKAKEGDVVTPSGLFFSFNKMTPLEKDHYYTIEQVKYDSETYTTLLSFVGIKGFYNSRYFYYKEKI